MRVCIISEGAYPVTRGGVGEWAHTLVGRLPDVEFDIFCLAASGKDQAVYESLPNLRRTIILPISGKQSFSRRRSTAPASVIDKLVGQLEMALRGQPLDCHRFLQLTQGYPGMSREVLRSESLWAALVSYYKANFPDVRFADFFWMWNHLFSTLLRIASFSKAIPDADVYHAINAGYAGFLGSLARTRWRKPLIATEHGLYLKEMRLHLEREDLPFATKHMYLNMFSSLVKTTYEHANLLTTICHDHIRMQRQIGADSREIRVIHNGIDCDRFAPAPKQTNGRLVIGTTARIAPIKGIDTLIRAARVVLREHDASFVVAGGIEDEDYYRECEALVRELGLQERFQFIGHADSLECYHKFDIFVLSSISEGVPLSLLEAMSCELPSVCTAVGGVPEIHPNSSTGYLVPSGDPDALAQRICELIRDPALRADMGHAARIWVRDRFHIDRMTYQYRDLYQFASDRTRGTARIESHSDDVRRWQSHLFSDENLPEYMPKQPVLRQN